MDKSLEEIYNDFSISTGKFTIPDFKIWYITKYPPNFNGINVETISEELDRAMIELMKISDNSDETYKKRQKLGIFMFIYTTAKEAKDYEPPPTKKQRTSDGKRKQSKRKQSKRRQSKRRQTKRRQTKRRQSKRRQSK
jgi:hypothetical protein